MSPAADTVLAGGLPLSAAVADQAVAWLTLLMSGEATDEDRDRWRGWRAAHADHERAWLHIEAMGARIRGLHGGAAYASLTQRGAAGGRRKALRTLAWLGTAGLGAVLAMRTGAWRGMAADHHAAIGERRELTLVDGTRVLLDSGSAIDLRFDAQRRVVRLVSGQALFTTGHGAAAGQGADGIERPFVVQTAQGEVRALGTRFLVRQDEGRSRVAVFEGTVELQPAHAPARRTVLRAGESAQLTSGEASAPVPAGAQAPALRALASTAGVPLSFTADQIGPRTTGGLRGRYTPQEAFSALLAGSGLEAVRLEHGGWVLRERPVPAAATGALPELKVRIGAPGESGTGPVAGYVAARTATGSKTDTPLVEVPQSVSVVTADEVAVRAASNIKDVVGYTAGVTPSGSLDTREDLTTFRGFPFDWASFYLDGLVMPSSTYGVSTAEPYGMERIEILRGPSSMLYGQNSTGGLLNMVSKRPTATPLREVQFQLGSNQRRQVAFDLGGPLGAAGEWSWCLTGLGRKSNTDVDYVADNRLFVAPALKWQPSAATSFTLLASYMADDLGDSGGTSAFLPSSGTLLPNPNGRIARSTYGGEPGFDHYRKYQRSFGWELRHRFDDSWQFTQNVRWRRVDVDYQTAYGLGLLASDPSRRTLRRGSFGSFGGTNGWVADNQLQADWSAGGIRHTTLLGLDLRYTKVDEVRYFGFTAPSIDLFDPVYGAAFALPATPDTSQVRSIHQAGFYAQDQMKFDQNWLLTAGLRFDRAHQEVHDRLRKVSPDRLDRKFTGRAGLTYLLGDGWAPYVSVATSFTPTLEASSAAELFKARTGRQVEAGVKYQPANSRSLYTAAVFDITQRNGLTADPANPARQIQAGRFRSRGLELEAKAELTKALNLIASYTWRDAAVSQSNDSNVGNAPKGIPRNTISVWADYSFHDEALKAWAWEPACATSASGPARMPPTSTGCRPSRCSTPWSATRCRAGASRSTPPTSPTRPPTTAGTPAAGTAPAAT